MNVNLKSKTFDFDCFVADSSFNFFMSSVSNRSTVDSFLLMEDEGFKNYVNELVKNKFEFNEVVEKSVEWVNENY
jgi:hypothetical protein